MKLTTLFITAVSLSLCACGNDENKNSGTSSSAAPSTPGTTTAPAPASSTAKGTEAEAKEMLSGFLKPDADLKALSAALKPDKADYEAVFTAEHAAKVEAAHAPLWAGNPALGPKEGQTELLLHAVPTSEIKTWTKNASDHLPGGYEGIKDTFKDGLTVYAFKFVKPGETLGMAFDGLVFVNGHWRLFPKPWKV